MSNFLETRRDYSRLVSVYGGQMNRIPEEIRIWVESNGQKLDPEVLAAAIESLLKCRDVYEQLAKN